MKRILALCLTVCLSLVGLNLGLLPETFGDRVNAYLKEYGGEKE